LEYEIEGLMKVPVLGLHLRIPFAHEGVFPVLRPPTVSTMKVQLEDVSLSKARIVADAEITNPNAFDVGIKDLSFALNLGNAQVMGLKTTDAAVAAKNKKRLLLSGEISAANGLINVLMNGISGEPEISASGLLQTPYGYIKL
jgi:LEA14-like dessication related protein